MGTARSAGGDELIVDSRSLKLNRKRWLPVMGEFHYSRYPASEWRGELIKMKLGGINIVATYVFWIHHEEAEGAFDWSCRRSLRSFVEQCADLGLYVVVRCGPWCHGECRNGGLPDWILKKGFATRTDDPSYLSCVSRLYRQISCQVESLLWKDGGPVVGVQVENEYNGPAEHLLSLKRLAVEAGLDVPLYTRTGWPDLTTPMPLGKLIPLYGAYPAGFWDRSLEEMPAGYGENFLFRASRNDACVATDLFGIREAVDGDDGRCYPYFACEIGGGMAASYHRRIRIDPKDIESLALVKIGCGNNLQGYYMYHGGTNPEGRFSTLQESQATGYWNDLPVKSYDFQTPLGEFGQVRPHYHTLRRMHLFLNDFGPDLADMPARLPERMPSSADDTSTLRWCARTDGRSGFLFVSNYERLKPMPAKPDVQFELKLDSGKLRIPVDPVHIPEDTTLFWPFNIDLFGVRLVYATAQPICSVSDETGSYVVFGRTTGVAAEFVFDASTATIESAAGALSIDRGHIRVRGVAPSTGAALRLRTPSGDPLTVILLDEEQSTACWKFEYAGRERLFLTHAALSVDGDAIRLRASDPEDLAVGILPAPSGIAAGGAALTSDDDGLFARFSVRKSQMSDVSISCERLQAAGPAREIALGAQGVAEAPTDDDFEGAAVWKLSLPQGADRDPDRRISISYVGDVARLYLDGKLLVDNFYNGAAFEMGLKRYAPAIYEKELLLKILPLRKDAPIYLPAGAWPEETDCESVVVLRGIDVIEEHEWELILASEQKAVSKQHVGGTAD